MTKIYEDKTFNDVYDYESSLFFESAVFRRCTFINAAISVTMVPEHRSRVRGIGFFDCKEKRCSVWSAMIEDVIIENLETEGLLQLWGAVFKHVELRGRIGRVMSSPAIKAGLAEAAVQSSFDRANAAYYENVDWALDISNADFEECELQRIPAKLVRRDPETQVVVTRANAIRGDWRRVDLGGTHWATSLEFFLERGDPDVVLVAGKRNRNFRKLVRGLRLLQDAGVAEKN